MELDQLSHFMEIALTEAKAAYDEGEVPVGAVIVHKERIIGRGHNRVEGLHDATAHAEMIALTAAYNHFEDWRLENCWLFSTLEPCVMCIGAALHSRIETLVYGAADIKFGACGSIVDIPIEEGFNHSIDVIPGVLAEESAALMQRFFRSIRKKRERIN